MRSKEYDTIVQVLMENPYIEDIGHGITAQTYLDYRYLRGNNHAKIGEHEGLDILHSSDGGNDWKSQYLLSNGKSDLARVDFGHAKVIIGNETHAIPYASMVIKSPKYQGNAYSFVKRAYDNELHTHGALLSDKTQYIGGQNLWKRMLNDYHNDGHVVGVRDTTTTKMQPMTPSEIDANSSDIWGTNPHHYSRRLFVMTKDKHDSIQKQV